MFTTTGWPRSARNCASKAFDPALEQSLTRRRSAASCGGAPAIGCDTSRERQRARRGAGRAGAVARLAHARRRRRPRRRACRATIAALRIATAWQTAAARAAVRRICSLCCAVRG